MQFMTNKTWPLWDRHPVPAAGYWHFQCENTDASCHHSANMRWSLRPAQLPLHHHLSSEMKTSCELLHAVLCGAPLWTSQAQLVPAATGNWDQGMVSDRDL